MSYAQEIWTEESNNFTENFFMAGEAIDDGSVTASYAENQFIGFKENFRIENGILKGYVYSSTANLLNNNAFRELSPIDFFIFENIKKFTMNAINGFEFFLTKVSYIWMPNLRNSLGRQAFQHSIWEKRAYFPFLENLGSRTFQGMPYGNDLRIYVPSLLDAGSQPFVFNNGVSSGKFNNTILYLDYNWNGVSNDVIDSFVNSGGTIRLIEDYANKPTTPTNFSISNVTTNSVEISFNSSAASNGMDFYEVFCENPYYKPSTYFPNKETINTSTTINGLESGKTYTVKVRAVDIYYNLSDFSESITFQTTYE